MTHIKTQIKITPYFIRVIREGWGKQIIVERNGMEVNEENKGPNH